MAFLGLLFSVPERDPTFGTSPFISRIQFQGRLGGVLDKSCLLIFVVLSREYGNTVYGGLDSVIKGFYSISNSSLKERLNCRK